MSSWEKDKVLLYLQDLLSCRLSHLPRELWLAPFVAQQDFLRDYRSCWASACSQDWGDLGRCHYKDCRDQSGTGRICGDTVSSSLDQQCPSVLPDIRGHLASYNTTKERSSLHQRMMVKTKSQFTDKEMQRILARFMSQEQCIVDLMKYVMPCRRKAQVDSSCANRIIHVVNMEGLPLTGLEALIKAMPYLYIVHTLTQAQNSSVPHGLSGHALLQDHTETTLISALSNIYPGVIHQTSYHNLTSKPKFYLTQVYSHFNMNIPAQLLNTFIRKLKGVQSGTGK